tara:strand:- start:818 stop:1066 length:249 start_codon:yes stop_codon:yes gene_type:complete
LPVYPVVNKNTGEQKEVSLSISEWENFKKENDEWIRDWSDPSTVPNNCETGEWKDKLIKKHPGWNDVLEKASRAPKSRVKKI